MSQQPWASTVSMWQSLINLSLEERSISLQLAGGSRQNLSNSLAQRQDLGDMWGKQTSVWQDDGEMSVSGLLSGNSEQEWGVTSRGTLGSEQFTRQISLNKDEVFRKQPSRKLCFYLGRAYSSWRHLHFSFCQIVRVHWSFLMSLSVVIDISDPFFISSGKPFQTETSTQSQAPAYNY